MIDENFTTKMKNVLSFKLQEILLRLTYYKQNRRKSGYGEYPYARRTRFPNCLPVAEILVFEY